MGDFHYYLSASGDDGLYVVTCHSVTRRTAQGARQETVCAGAVMKIADDVYAAELHGKGQAATPIAGQFHSLEAAQRAIELHYDHLHFTPTPRRRRAPRRQKAR